MLLFLLFLKGSCILLLPVPLTVCILLPDARDKSVEDVYLCHALLVSFSKGTCKTQTAGLGHPLGFILPHSCFHIKQGGVDSLNSTPLCSALFEFSLELYALDHQLQIMCMQSLESKKSSTICIPMEIIFKKIKQF